jgi:hypothetical protein
MEDRAQLGRSLTGGSDYAAAPAEGLHCSGPLCWYFCWYRQVKRAAANFAILNDGIEQMGRK